MSHANEGKMAPAVVAELYDQYSGDLRRFLVGLLRDSQLANDVLQTTFVKLTELGHTTREQSRKGWLFRVAYREAMLVRRRGAIGDAVLRRAVWSRNVVTEPADDGIVRRETVDRIRSAIDALPPAQQQVVRMRMYEEKTFAEIAAELQIPLGTALGRMHAASGKLRKVLNELRED